MVSLRWLDLFRDFERARVVIRGRCTWPISTPPWTLLVEGDYAS